MSTDHADAESTSPDADPIRVSHYPDPEAAREAIAVEHDTAHVRAVILVGEEVSPKDANDALEALASGASEVTNHGLTETEDES